MKYLALVAILVSLIFVISTDQAFAMQSEPNQGKMGKMGQMGHHHFPHNGMCAPGFAPLDEICVLDDRCGPGAYPGKVCKMDGVTKPYLRPLQQRHAGISLDNIICAEGKELIFKSHNAAPACVNPESVVKLMPRGWQTEKPPIACTLQYDPVCGMDGVTYGNRCMMNAEYMVERHAGECQPKITNFEDCIAAGNPALESHPRQCRTPDGLHFVEKLDGVFPKAMQYTKQAPILGPNGYFVDEIADGIFWVFGDRYQAMFVTTGKGVIVVDAPQPLGEKYIQAINDVTEEPITHMIYSHAHADHTAAAGQIFPPDIEYIAHQDAADVLIEQADPNRPIPTITFEDAYTLEVGRQVLELYYIGPFHSAGDIVILAPRQDVAMAVDLFHPGGAPYRAFARTIDMDTHIMAHDVLVDNFDYSVLISGHMEILGTKDHIKTDKEFIFSVMDNIKTALETVPQDEVIQSCIDSTIQQWTGKLVELEVYMEDHCTAMLQYVTSQPEFTVEYTKSGGIAGINQVYTVVSSEKSIKIVNHDNDEYSETVSDSEIEELKSLIQKSDFFTTTEDYPPQDGWADYFEYSLKISFGNQVNEITWTDASETIPEAAQMIAQRVESLASQNLQVS